MTINELIELIEDNSIDKNTEVEVIWQGEYTGVAKPIIGISFSRLLLDDKNILSNKILLHLEYYRNTAQE